MGQHSTCGRAWRGVATGGGSRACHQWARRKRQPPEGELLQWAPQIHHHLDHHLYHSFPGRTRPKKEDWLKKKDRKQRRPGCRRKKTRKRGDCLESHSDPLTDTPTTPAAAKQLIGHEGQRTLLRPSGGFPPGVA